MTSSIKPFGVFLGRLNPITVGHQRNIEKMVATCGKCSLIVIGSSNAPMSLRHFFNYSERRAFIRMLFPTVQIVGLPDYHSDDVWLTALDDLITLAGAIPKNVTFFSGSEDDAKPFLAAGRQVEILDRFSGPLPKISGTEVRDLLISGSDLSSMISPVIAPQVVELFQVKWEAFRRI